MRPLVAEPSLTPDQGYRIWAPSYSKYSNYIVYVERRHTEQRLLNLNISGDVLDVGCGTGLNIRVLSSNSARLYAIDPVYEMIKRAIQETDGIRVSCAIARGEEVPFPEDSFDVIICTLVVDHIQDIKRFISALSRVARPNARLFITDVNPSFELAGHLYAEFYDCEGRQHQIQVWPHMIPEVRKTLQKYGFTAPEISKVRVLESDTAYWPQLRSMVGYPLIIEYLSCRKPCGARSSAR